jgi:sugar phosphate isomerase/epimerase
VTNVVSFMTANYVARQTGYAMHGWGHGDRAANEWFAPLETYEQRFGELTAGIRVLGFDAIDLWGAHLHQSWATDEHVATARAVLARDGLGVSSYATYVGAGEAERVCDIAAALDTALLGGMASDLPGAVPVLRERNVKLGIENHPEKSPAELLAKIGDNGDVLGVTTDTGWWATQGYDAARAIEELAGHVLHVHLKDVLATGEPHETCAWGEGIVPIEESVRALQRIGYTGGIAVEHEPETFDPSKECAAMLGRLKAWLQ